MEKVEKKQPKVVETTKQPTPSGSMKKTLMVNINFQKMKASPPPMKSASGPKSDYTTALTTALMPNSHKNLLGKKRIL